MKVAGSKVTRFCFVPLCYVKGFFMSTTTQELLPIELVFNPNWWYHAADISFDKPFYFDADTRIKNDVTMRRVLYERFGDIGLGEADPQPRPIIGSPWAGRRSAS